MRRSGLSDLLVRMAGADPDILAKMPSQEQSYYQRLGSTVFISGGMAALGMGVTVWALVAGVGGSSDAWQTLWAGVLAAVAGLLWGTAIILIDRMLIAQPLRPMTVDMKTSNGPPTFRSAPAWSILPRLLPRLILALTIGVLVAEPLLVLAFRDEVEQRSTRIADVAEKSAVDDAQRTLDARLSQLALKNPEQLELERLESELLPLQQDFDAAAGREATANELAEVETKNTAPVKVGSTKTTGVPRCGPVCQGHQADAAIAKGEKELLDARITELNTKIEEARIKVGDSETNRLEEYRSAEQEGRENVRRAQQASQFTTGILLRVQALEQLASSEYPFGGEPPEPPTATDAEESGAGGSGTPGTTPVSPSPASTSGTTLATAEVSETDRDLVRAERTLGLTAMGIAIWLVRLFLIVLDTMPVLAKTLMSLRAERPYEQEATLRDAQVTHAQRLRLATLDADTTLVHRSIAEARRAAFDSAGGLWVDGGDRLIFVGPNGSLTVPNGNDELSGLQVDKQSDGTWLLGAGSGREARGD